MVQELNHLQKEVLFTEQWKEERIHQQKQETTTSQPDKEMLLHREMARLRLKLKLGKAEVRRN